MRFGMVAVFAIGIFSQVQAYATPAASAPSQDEVLKRLDELLASQKQVLAKLDEMKQELDAQ